VIVLFLIGFAVIGYFFARDLWGAFTGGVVHARGYPYHRAENPVLFWMTVGTNTAFLLILLGFVVWLAGALGS